MWPNPQETADFVTFTEEILDGKLFFCGVRVFEDYLKSKIKNQKLCTCR